MTNDEILYAVGETLGSLEVLRAQLESRVRGKKVRAYGDRTMQIVEVTASAHPYGGLRYGGYVLNKDGSKNKAMSKYFVEVEGATLLD